jgi:hypothetical protein
MYAKQLFFYFYGEFSVSKQQTATEKGKRKKPQHARTTVISIITQHRHFVVSLGKKNLKRGDLVLAKSASRM